MIGRLKALFRKAPPSWLETVKAAYELIPPRRRYGKEYSDCLELLTESDHWDSTDIAEYQNRMLSALIEHCFHHVPYYREVFDERGLTPSDVRTVADLPKLPFLTKDIVARRSGDLVADNMPASRREPFHTSGSTGKPLEFFITPAVLAMDRALYRRHIETLGYRPGDRIAVLRGDVFADSRTRYRTFPGSDIIKFSVRDLGDAAISDITDALNRFRPAIIRAFPSALWIVAHWMERNHKSVPPPKCLLTSSETVSQSLREDCERVFRAPLADFYGQNEYVAAAGQCRSGSPYHVHGELGVTELVESSPPYKEIVGTCLHNYAMPFIRYRTGDLAVEAERPCGCGTSHPLLNRILGREGDFLITPEGRLIPATVVDNAVNHLREIREAQFFQPDVENLIVRVVPWTEISQKTRDRLLHEVRSRLGSERIHVSIEVTDDIPRSSGGKRKIVVSDA